MWDGSIIPCEMSLFSTPDTSRNMVTFDFFVSYLFNGLLKSLSWWILTAVHQWARPCIVVPHPIYQLDL
jgi:hypothetical protein